MTEEEILIERLHDLHRAYEVRARPLIDRLVYLQGLKPPPPIVMPPLTSEQVATLLAKFPDALLKNMLPP